MFVPRRIVTGYRDGKSVILSDENQEGITLRSIPGQRTIEMWNAKADLQHPVPSEYSPSNGKLPGPGETQFIIFTMPPSSVFSSPDFDPEAAEREHRELFPGYVHDPDHPGMHATPSLDYAVVLNGSVTLIVEDGVECIVHAGDVVVQCGALHGWRNVTDQPATMALVVIGAKN